MSLPTKSDLAAYHAGGGVYESSKDPNDVVVLNIYGNNQFQNEDKSTELIETEADLKLNDIHNNKIPTKSVLQTPNNILVYDKIRDNGYPLSDNSRNQLAFNDKYLKPINNINNINNNAINEVVIHQNNNPQNYNVFQHNTGNALPMFNDIVEANNNAIPNIQNQNEDFQEIEIEEFDCKTCCKNTFIIFLFTLLVIIFIPIIIFCGFILKGTTCSSGSTGSIGFTGSTHSSNSCRKYCNCKKKKIKRIKK